jgi:hypothetical protein
MRITFCNTVGSSGFPIASSRTTPPPTFLRLEPACLSRPEVISMLLRWDKLSARIAWSSSLLVFVASSYQTRDCVTRRDFTTLVMRTRRVRTRFTRAIGSMLQWLLQAPALLQGGTVAQPPHRPSQHLHRSQTSNLPGKETLLLQLHRLLLQLARVQGEEQHRRQHPLP